MWRIVGPALCVVGGAGWGPAAGAARWLWGVAGEVTVLGVTGRKGLGQLWGVFLGLQVGLSEPGLQPPLLPQAQGPFTYFQACFRG